MALNELSQRGLRPAGDTLEPVDPVAAKAVPCLTWLLTDPDGDKHPASAGFGPFVEVRRWVRVGTPEDDTRRDPWVALARRAWAARPTLNEPAEPVEWLTPGPKKGDCQQLRQAHESQLRYRTAALGLSDHRNVPA